MPFYLGLATIRLPQKFPIILLLLSYAYINSLPIVTVHLTYSILQALGFNRKLYVKQYLG